MIFSSSLLENAVNEFAKLPGIGKKTALRLVLHLIKQHETEVNQFSEVIAKMRNEIKFCSRCYNISDSALCNICSNPMRKKELLCVVENIRDVIAIESTQQFNGLYHVLGGIISPLDGIGPERLMIDALIDRISNEEIDEIIFALSPTIQGDTTIYYISKKIAGAGLDKKSPVKITTIARGISFGGELEYADEMTLAKSISNRIPVENFIVSGN
ncbi:MAG: recombination protein RecR [Chitinophagaceae bacterium]|nr:recombination protein RecR [Chitinophagaceae bacterium]